MCKTVCMVILINPFLVPPAKIDDAIAMWEKARDFLSSQPGYISTALHRARDEQAQFLLINVARWESEDAFYSASKRMREEAGLQPVEGVTSAPALYSIIRV